MAHQPFRRRTLLTAAALGATLTACTGDEQEELGGSGKVGGLISIITPSPANIFYKTESDAAIAEAQRLGYKSQADSHDDDASTQSTLFDTAIAAGAAAIICDNAGADVTIGAVRKAVDAGVPVFLIDREINEREIATAQIVANNSQGAGLVAESFVEAMGAEGRYVELLGREVDTNAQVRTNAFHSIIDQYEGLTMAAQDTANWDQQEAFTKTQTLLQAHPDITGIVAGNDTMAVGAVAAVDAAGRTGDIVVVGFDGSPDAVDAIRAGKMQATGMQPAVLISEMAVQQADQFIRTGETGVPEKQSVDCLLIDPSNADRYTLFEVE